MNLHKREKARGNTGALLRDVILGGQDGLVNVLGIVLGVAAATGNPKIVIIAGLAATVSESVSMAAVAYTSSKASRDYYRSKVDEEMRRIEEQPARAREKLRGIFRAKGFGGRLLEQIVSTISTKKVVWLNTLVSESKTISQNGFESPAKSALIVGFASLVGSLVPLTPYFFGVANGIPTALILSTTVLLVTGTIKAKLTIGDWRKSAIEMAVIGILSALAGYAVGVLLKVNGY